MRLTGLKPATQGLGIPCSIRTELEGLNNKFGHDVYYPSILSAIKKEDFRRNWEIRLTNQIKDLPTYELIVVELEELITEKLITTQKYKR